MRLSMPWLLAAFALTLAIPAASGSPLQPEECKTLKSEYDTLVEAGAKSDMRKGADWAKTHFKQDQLDRIARLITVEEKLSFRCGQIVTAVPNMKELPEETAAKSPAAKGLSRIPIPVKKSVATAGMASQTTSKKK